MHLIFLYMLINEHYHETIINGEQLVHLGLINVWYILVLV